MITRTEIERLAAAANQLRPDWPIPSLVTHLSNHHAARPYRDLAVALAWIAADPETKTPARLLEAGPWWVAAVADTASKPTATPVPPSKCERCGGFWRTPEGVCLDCEAPGSATPGAPVPPPAESRAAVRRALRVGAS